MLSSLGRVLIVEDDPDVVAVLRFALKGGATTEIVVMNDGQEALEAARSSPPDLILCDLMLPGMDGLKLAEALRSGSPRVDAPLIFITAAAGTAFRTATPQDYGACGVLLKPFRVQTLRAELGALLAANGRR